MNPQDPTILVALGFLQAVSVAAKTKPKKKEHTPNVTRSQMQKQTKR
jgi:hypothetical protein